jgi:hypothetical protein
MNMIDTVRYGLEARCLYDMSEILLNKNIGQSFEDWEKSFRANKNGLRAPIKMT